MGCRCTAVPPSCATPIERFDDRELAVLLALSWDGTAQVAFQGLRRQLGLHQQILTRTLRRLSDDGLVEKVNGAYALTEEGSELLSGCDMQRPDWSVPPRLEALLPAHVGPLELEASLAGRWFNGLHWYGRVEGPGEVQLLWLTDPGGHLVRARLHGGQVTLETEAFAPETEHLSAARAILATLADLYAKPRAATDTVPEPSLSYAS